MKITREAEERAKKIVIRLIFLLVGLIYGAMFVIDRRTFLVIFGILSFSTLGFVLVSWLMGAFTLATASEEDDEEEL